jgi:hypothetical protein
VIYQDDLIEGRHGFRCWLESLAEAASLWVWSPFDMMLCNFD